MANIFENIGTGIGNVFSGLGRHFQRSYESTQAHYGQAKEQQKTMELMRQIRILEAMPQGSEQQVRMAESIMKKYKPEIAAMAKQGDYQEQQRYGALPGAYQHLTPDEQREASLRYGGLKPRARSPWDELREKAETEAYLGVDPTTGKPRFPELSDQIRKDISGFQVPGAKAKARLPGLAEKVSPWLDEDLTPQVEPEKRGVWDFLKDKTKNWGKFWWQSQVKKQFKKTGEGYAPKVSGPDKEYGKPSAPTMIQLQKEAGIYDRTKRAKPMPPAPRRVDEHPAYKKVRAVWYKMPKEVQDKIQSALDAGVTWPEILASEDVQKYVR